MEQYSSKSNSDHFKTNFCLALANQVLENEAKKGSNFVASPLSLHAMLSLVAAGSTGHTLEQMLFFLGSKSVDDLSLLSSYVSSLISQDDGSEDIPRGGPLLSFVNGAWLDQRFNLKPSFEAIVKHSHKAEIRTVDFVNKPKEAVDEVNSWVEEATKGLISGPLSYESVNCDTAIIFANALYFKGLWDQNFDASRTQTRDFYLLNGQIVQVPFMTTNTRFHQYRCYDVYMVLKLPYQSGQDPRKFSMYFFLPNEKDGLFNLIQKVKSNPDLLNIQKFDLTKDELTDFWIPKFKFSFGFEAPYTMKKMGLILPFSPGELTEVVTCPYSRKKLFVSNIFHKSCIEVNEEGTEAAAVTVVICEVQCLRYYEYPSFVADHPFLFMIREETHGIVFFVGAMLNPLLDS